MLRVVYSESYNPYYNLALEEVLLHSCEQKQDYILYLWQNNNTIVIGRNQTVYTECDLQYVKKYNTKIARRLTGGGAVYHDLGNLNFTFIVPKKAYDKTTSTSIIVNAINAVGISVRLAGRNDIVCGDFKFSGSAYYSSTQAGLHHGTIMVDVDLEKMQKLLYTSQSKIAKKGVSSVRSRVVNLKMINPDISVDRLKEAIKFSFIKTLGEDSIIKYGTDYLEEAETVKLEKRYSSEQWNIKQVEEYDLQIEEKYDWGYFKLSCCMDGHTPQKFSISSDSLYPDMVDSVVAVFNDKNMVNLSQLKKKINSYPEIQIIEDIEQLYCKLLEMM